MIFLINNSILVNCSMVLKFIIKMIIKKIIRRQ